MLKIGNLLQARTLSLIGPVPGGGAAAAPGEEQAAPDKYANMDFGKYTSQFQETEGTPSQERRMRQSWDSGGGMITNPRMRNCLASIALGAKMGAAVGGCFGTLSGLIVAYQQRNPFILPLSMVGGAVSFGFFLGCGMIIRCEERKGEGEEASRSLRVYFVPGVQHYRPGLQTQPPPYMASSIISCDGAYRRPLLRLPTNK